MIESRERPARSNFAANKVAFAEPFAANEPAERRIWWPLCSRDHLQTWNCLGLSQAVQPRSLLKVGSSECKSSPLRCTRPQSLESIRSTDATT